MARSAVQDASLSGRSIPFELVPRLPVKFAVTGATK
jgi:hypothetical protein